MKAVVCTLICLAVSCVAYAHPGGLAKDDCHKDNSVSERHWHVADTTERGGECVTENGETQKLTPCPVCEAEIVEVVVEKVVEKVVTRNSVDVQAFEDAHQRVLSAIRQALDRPPVVHEVEVAVPDLKATDEQCRQKRTEFLAAYNKWGDRSEDIALQAINSGCW